MTPCRWRLPFAIRLAVGAALIFSSGASAQQNNAPPPSHTIFYVHGRIYTNDPAHPWAAAMSVRDGKIACIGSIAHVIGRASCRERVLRLV